MGDSVREKCRVLVCSPDADLGRFLSEGVPSAAVDVIVVEPGPAFVRAVRRERPEIAVLDGVDGRVDVALMEIAVLKDMRPDVRIIAVSGAPSPADARIVERGVFYYTSSPTTDDLVQVVEAAARAWRGASSN